MRTHHPSQQKGFALLLAVVIAGILVSITYIMFSISLKQITLSTTGKNSQYALFAADTGIECALNADYKIEVAEGDAFAKITSATDNSGNTVTTVAALTTPTMFKCNSQNIVYDTSSPSTDPVTINGATYNKAITYTFTLNLDSSRCAKVSVSKYIENQVSGTISTDYVKTRIKSYGYNSCTTLDPQRLERGLEVYY